MGDDEVSALRTTRAVHLFNARHCNAFISSRQRSRRSASIFMSARLKPPGTLGFSLARLCATQGSAYAYKDALEEYKPTLEKVVKNELTLPVPGRPISRSHVSRPRERGCGQGHDLVYTRACAGGRHGSTSRNDPGLEARVHSASLTYWGLCFLSASM